MPRGDKSSYTNKQKRKAEHIAESCEKRGVPAQDAKSRAWATVNKDDGGGNKSGAGRGTHTGNPAAKKGGKKAAKLLPRARPKSDQTPPEKPHKPESATTQTRNAAAMRIPRDSWCPCGLNRRRQGQKIAPCQIIGLPPVTAIVAPET